ncbi:spore germination protein [Anoxybacillus flavithermus]|uniref:spore germination protein n=1 Tax=Anoxybacillus flavithermus TaxID=33934 RepID=UPI0018678D1B|nr:spore germination protein [Anoxybacillus flavithermus]MBE2943629.1 spore germination protein [Anoxybacillus flavithermus]MBE2951922.1 spore germination protein [Anoxybacillus flavithermus]MBE2954514.1 spore germination protein [Anoxybacillus flavithermus]MBE2959930.1 spore germination protein [Anoxybacillus flavithermus]
MMWFSKKNRVDEVAKQLAHSPDLMCRRIQCKGKTVDVLFLSNLINHDQLQQNVLAFIYEQENVSIEQLARCLPIGAVHICETTDDMATYIRDGWAGIYIEKEKSGLAVNIAENIERSLEKAETESLVLGPKISFTEAIDKNIRILRQNITDQKLVTEKMTIGMRNPLEVRVVYIEDIADEENIQTVKQRLSELHIDEVTDSSVLAQLLEDHAYTIFPQYLLTELPDRLAYSLMKGRIGIFVDRSPTVIICPTTFFSFFESTEDIYLRWTMSIVLRAIRMFGIFSSIFLSPLYVAVITYHYEVIPSALLLTIGESRSRVPFPPVIEALLLEFMIELLREAGARLPTKVGQTMSIVGGIVLGQAAVDAGFTSNVLIIIVALSALGSFTAPSYEMGATIRILRFPIILLAALWGLVGILIGVSMLLVHLLKLTSLGRPYLSPVYPFRFADMKYALIRLPQKFYSERPKTNRPQNSRRFSWREAMNRKDLDE